MFWTFFTPISTIALAFSLIAVLLVGGRSGENLSAVMKESKFGQFEKNFDCLKAIVTFQELEEDFTDLKGVVGISFYF